MLSVIYVKETQGQPDQETAGRKISDVWYEVQKDPEENFPPEVWAIPTWDENGDPSRVQFTWPINERGIRVVEVSCSWKRETLQ